ncbi:hypothetical protein GPZ77_00960 [Streptomyces sp. QHH-9511]|uniref:hypothetical protein n=1 Tax=Streptomyces sp. QHH-9511 TaxID=2684468 RepID=UPI0013181183|nr:hypothetical protein [Streptomyces sp. QHH-9511]QGZ47167.1 hypothetical protein GPZ77_00960 [Streptomyces sp. QHH-9511]
MTKAEESREEAVGGDATVHQLPKRKAAAAKKAPAKNAVAKKTPTKKAAARRRSA